jgi:ATP-binding cassette subfamily B protein
MNYTLRTFKKGDKNSEKGEGVMTALKRFGPLLSGEKKNIIIALIAVVITSASSLVTPLIIAHTINTYILNKEINGVLMFGGLLLVIYLIGVCTQYTQTIVMGTVGRRVLYNLRNSLFTKIQELPVAFFNQNKAGDLISRINSDTDQLNQFFGQALMQFFGNFFLIFGAAIFLLALNIKLGASALLPAVGVLIITRIVSSWVKRKNLSSLQSLGSMSGEIQESLENFKVIIAFNRLDYFRTKFNGANQNNYSASIGAGIANSIFTPLYTFASSLAQLIVLSLGIYLITKNALSVGLLVGYFLYVNNFYNPLQQLASVWSSFQLALAAFDRISEILDLHTDMEVVVTDGANSNTSTGQKTNDDNSKYLLEFKHVSFGYPNGKEVLKDINIQLERGKTYALVGPTGGGKTTTASLVARLYDPTKGTVMFGGRDLRSYTADERAQKIGFITQEPFLFTGSVRENIIYGNDSYKDFSSEQLREVLDQAGLSNLLARFEEGLDTQVSVSGGTVSLGQKQLIAFIRAVLRKPDLLILDEATANIDTVTEQLLDEILSKLPASTSKIVIAHRLNTINNADQIFFVNGGEVIAAGSMQNAVDLLLHGKRQS